MTQNKNEYHVVAFDPGGVSGWAHFVVHKKAFIAPNNKLLHNIIKWNTGEFSGTEFEQVKQAVRLVHRARYGAMPYVAQTDVVIEDFELTQIIGGKDLLLPVRFTAILQWECSWRYAITPVMQNRTLRTGITRDRLKLWNFWPVAGKDSFAAMQHAITWLRRIKQKANERPWKLDR
jgi:hypothetical protein